VLHLGRAHPRPRFKIVHRRVAVQRRRWHRGNPSPGLALKSAYFLGSPSYMRNVSSKSRPASSRAAIDSKSPDRGAAPLLCAAQNLARLLLL
jgi:hypothetical protein